MFNQPDVINFYRRLVSFLAAILVIPEIVRECSNYPLDEVDAKNKEVDRTHK
jgi:hypothetical protein